jgi:ABC-2 type transport system permease protein/sodium transport system permease protein
MSVPLPPGFRDNLARLGRLIRKELSESLRDRRTVLTLILMPLLLYPVLAMAFQQMLLSSRVEKLQPLYRLAFTSEEQASALFDYWRVGREQMVRRHAGPAKKKSEVTISPYLEPIPELRPFLTTDVAEAVREGMVDVGIKLDPPVAFKPDPTRPLFVNVEVFYREGSANGREAIRHIEQMTADANATLVGQGLRLMGVMQRGDPVRIHASILAIDSAKRSSLVPVLVPLILVLMTMTGAVYPAIDLTAGERERRTLEILVAAPIPRLSVLLAKYFAVLTVAMLTALANLGSMAITLQVTGLGSAIFGASLTVSVLAQILALLLLFATFFSAVLLTLTSFARSFKEAQAYLIPLMLFSLTPGIMALMPGLSLRGPLAVVPLINIVLLARDVLEFAANPGVVNPASANATIICLVVLTTILYALAAIAFAARIFGAEAVLSSETSGWGDLFRRPTESRPFAEPAWALGSLAVLFPISFLVNAGLARIEGLDLGTRLLLACVGNVVLFAGVPMLASVLGRIRWASGLALRAPGWQACIVAVLLGASLWPFVHELVLFLQRAGVTTLREEHRERISALVAQWREVSPWLIVLAMAVVPAVVEELFFRGYLLSSLLGEEGKPVRAVVGSAALFAVFHLLVSDALAVERLLPSFLLGLVLGWLAYSSRSVVPGMFLHMLHNGAIVLLGYYEPQLIEAGWATQGQEHFPLWLLSSAAGLAVPGLMWLWWLGRARPQPRAG